VKESEYQEYLESLRKVPDIKEESGKKFIATHFFK